MHFQYYFLLCTFAFTDLTKFVHLSPIVKRQAPSFHPTQVGTVKSDKITEASGLAASRKHPGFLYTHNDHGGHAEIYVISASSGHREATIELSGVTSNDWEDIAIGRCHAGPSDFCIYIGDFGDGGKGALNNIYRIAEPDAFQNHMHILVSSIDKLEFSWNQKDCETLMIDPNANLYIISKVHNAHGTIAALPNHAWGTGSRVDVSSTAILNIESPTFDPVGGDISFDGNEVLIKAHHAVFYWNMGGSNDYLATLQTPGTKVTYIDEPQGESVCWDASGLGYYTLSEGNNEHLYHYIRT
ncbi:uncharacterized protein LOC123537600 [Mercenaria mercenaria]|uniref:uncharacterized protein LOC123537600 n=1 Tax=Mercenaria mercenaria TaxID=6596 RepID=UPI00234F7F4C|nr:uncharacterized protein LOC123537600 [Mercenaria mercenaria]